VADVFFEGAHSFTQTNCATRSRRAVTGCSRGLTAGGVLKEEQLDEDKEKLADFYHDAGYIDFDSRMSAMFMKPAQAGAALYCLEGPATASGD